MLAVYYRVRFTVLAVDVLRKITRVLVSRIAKRARRVECLNRVSAHCATARVARELEHHLVFLVIGRAGGGGGGHEALIIDRMDARGTWGHLFAYRNQYPWHYNQRHRRLVSRYVLILETGPPFPPVPQGSWSVSGLLQTHSASFAVLPSPACSGTSSARRSFSVAREVRWIPKLTVTRGSVIRVSAAN